VKNADFLSKNGLKTLKITLYAAYFEKYLSNRGVEFLLL